MMIAKHRKQKALLQTRYPKADLIKLHPKHGYWQVIFYPPIKYMTHGVEIAFDPDGDGPDGLEELGRTEY